MINARCGVQQTSLGQWGIVTVMLVATLTILSDEDFVHGFGHILGQKNYYLKKFTSKHVFFKFQTSVVRKNMPGMMWVDSGGIQSPLLTTAFLM